MCTVTADSHRQCPLGLCGPCPPLPHAQGFSKVWQRESSAMGLQMDWWHFGWLTLTLQMAKCGLPLPFHPSPMSCQGRTPDIFVTLSVKPSQDVRRNHVCHTACLQGMHTTRLETHPASPEQAPSGDKTLGLFHVAWTPWLAPRVRT